ncbi:MAG: ABC transporter permease, partial [Methylobacteriaceae bacterium]|nr:ABC transporter permease [Methylobacteriaceae bacterium]
MLRFLLSRLAKGVAVLFAIAIVNFLLIRAAPGDPAAVMAGEAGAADAVFIQQLRERFGLDRSLPEQLGIYLGGIARLDLGYSYRQGRSVASLIGDRLPATLLLTGTAFAISLALGTLLGAL